MAQLSKKHRRGNLSKRVAETEKNTTARVGSVVGSSSLETSANSHEDEAESDKGRPETSKVGGKSKDEKNAGADNVRCNRVKVRLDLVVSKSSNNLRQEE